MSFPVVVVTSVLPSSIDFPPPATSDKRCSLPRITVGTVPEEESAPSNGAPVRDMESAVVDGTVSPTSRRHQDPHSDSQQRPQPAIGASKSAIVVVLPQPPLPRMSKRPRVGDSSSSSSSATCASTATATATTRTSAMPKQAAETSVLIRLLEGREWEAAARRASSHPGEVRDRQDPSALAVACRVGAPLGCVRAILDACPEKVRNVLDSRGTPLHEAIVCEDAGIDVIDALVRADEALEEVGGAAEPDAEAAPVRAALLQDVDGFTPLHLLIRRRFQFHMLHAEGDDDLLQILEVLVRSCPEAVVIPDRGEYEEPPIVYAIKANMYAPSLGSEDETISRVELKIYEMVSCMLRHYPRASSCVFTGYRGQYTALHSAVFHGRCTDTIRLLLETEAAHPSSPPMKAALLGNTQGEIPLHFCVMRGERPKSVDLIARAAPEGVWKRDATGLTPIHWLWIRFVSTLLALDDGGRGGETVMQIVDPHSPELNRYKEFWSLEQNDFDLDLQLIRRVDPPVDFLRMRHIPPEVQDEDDSQHWAARVFDVLDRLRETHESRQTNEGTVWNRLEVVTSLFWNKVVSLLEASQIAGSDHGPIGPSPILVHSAFASPCCVPAVAWIAASLFPHELFLADARGRLPVHYAAMRRWNAWDWPRDDGLAEPTASRLLQLESLRMLKTAIEMSGSRGVRVADRDGRLALHHAVETFVHACTCLSRNPGSSDDESDMQEVLEVIRRMVSLFPDSLQRRDSASKLFPFLQATALATELRDQLHRQELLPLSMTFLLLRTNPTLLSFALAE